MGLIRAGLNAAGGVLADQWKEFFTCEAIPEGVLALKGRKSGGRRSVNRGSDNIITSGSVILVADGQCMMIVDQGKVVEFAAEPGEYTYDASAATLARAWQNPLPSSAAGSPSAESRPRISGSTTSTQKS